MTDKLTDKDVIKALPNMTYGGHYCAKCKYDNGKGNDRCGLKGCKIARYALDFINRLQAKAIKEQNKNSKLRNERNRLQAQNKDLAETVHNLTIEKDALFDKAEELKAEIERLNALVKTKNKLIEGLDQSISYAYDRAIKDFAERLKNEIINDTAYACDSTQHSGYYDYQIKIGDMPEYIDNLVKEMAGDDNA